MKYEIQNDVPIPDFGTGRGRPQTHPWPEMSAGQSVLIQTTKINSLRCSLTNWKAQNPDQKWVTQRVPNGLRVWRAA